MITQMLFYFITCLQVTDTDTVVYSLVPVSKSKNTDILFQSWIVFF